MTAPFTTIVLEQSLWGSADFILADVGASGGIAHRWHVFGDRLSAVGFDPLTAEVDRLTALERRPKVRYVAAHVGCPHCEQFRTVSDPGGHAGLRQEPYRRTSAVKALEIQQHDYVRERFNAGSEIVYTDTHLSLDGYFTGQEGPDFIKIDTDGHDYPVLLGAESLLKARVLGVEVEVQFHGAAHDDANVFSNIDKLLRACGFSLFDLCVYRYSRAALPAPFAYDIPAQTTSGQVVWGDAVYFRDPTHEAYKGTVEHRLTREQLLKLCCLFELYGLPDCAAELLATSNDLRSLPARAELLDALTPAVFGPLSYREYVRRFHDDPASFFPSRIAASRSTDAAATVAVDANRAAADESEPVVEEPPAPDGEQPAQEPAAQDRDKAAQPTERLEQLEHANTRLLARVRKLKYQRRLLRERLKKRTAKLVKLQMQLRQS